MSFMPPIYFPENIDYCPTWMETMLRRHENIVDEENALSAAEAEIAHRSKAIGHQYSDLTPIGRLTDGQDRAEEEEEEEEADAGDEEYESPAEGDMDDMDADDYYLDDHHSGLNTATVEQPSPASPVTVSITLPLPSTSATSTSTTESTTQQQATNSETPVATVSAGTDQNPIVIEDQPAAVDQDQPIQD